MIKAKFTNFLFKNADRQKVVVITQEEGKEEVSRRERRRQRLMAKIVMLERNYFTEGGA